MEIRIVDVNDAQHPLKTGEMEIDRVNNIMYVGGQFGVADIDFRGLVNMLYANIKFNRLPEYYLGAILQAYIKVGCTAVLSTAPTQEVIAVILGNTLIRNISISITRGE